MSHATLAFTSIPGKGATDVGGGEKTSVHGSDCWSGSVLQSASGERLSLPSRARPVLAVVGL